jgi:hypothetical protein
LYQYIYSALSQKTTRSNGAVSFPILEDVIKHITAYFNVISLKAIKNPLLCVPPFTGTTATVLGRLQLEFKTKASLPFFPKR